MSECKRRCPKCGSECEVMFKEIFCLYCDWEGKIRKPDYGERLEKGFAMWNVDDE